ncbi:hypothetical protein EC973_009486 [Apophysomyces ossiformis]|uniref:SH3 domain-containing protein n=1 Tax=Apophysomyces ossiformis TaxID=679940 RepID=A0A8H7ESY1_9FUNG|nr:hypothetical protein EC973_009486 [Apophysomyces ossiformis]
MSLSISTSWHGQEQRQSWHNLDEITPEEDEDEGMTIEDGSSSISSSPSIPDENINFSLVYALHTFTATVEGQASVVKGDALILMEDTNIYWWLVEVLETREIGYIPAENIETPYERLARLNKHRNVEITSPASGNHIEQAPVRAKNRRNVTIAQDAELEHVYHYEVESDEESITEESEMDIIPMYEDETTTQYPIEDNFAKEVHPSDVRETCSGTACHDPSGRSLDLRVFAGNIGKGPLFHSFNVSMCTTAEELLREAISRFEIQDFSADDTEGTIEYYLAVHGTDGEDCVLAPQDKPLSIFKTLTTPLTTPMPSVTHLPRPAQSGPQQAASIGSAQRPSVAGRRPRSSSFSSYEKTSYEEDSVIRFYLHRRIKRAHEREGLVYIKVMLYPDAGASSSTATASVPDPAAAVHTSPFTPSFIRNKKKKVPRTTEIDRMDKIIPVRQDLQVGAVINIALQKFHVPDAEAYNYHTGESPSGRSCIPYRLSVRAGDGKETDLQPNDLMSMVLQQQQQQMSQVPVTSELLFIVRRADTEPKRSGQLTSSTALTATKAGPEPRRPSLTPTLTMQERRPSILDILMDSPRPDDRRPSLPVSVSSDRRPSSTRSISTAEETRLAPFTSTHLATGSRRSSVVLLSSNNNSSTSLDDRLNSDSGIEGSVKGSNQGTDSPRSNKKDTSLKQQLKRLMGWGKPKKSTPSSSESFYDQNSLQQNELSTASSSNPSLHRGLDTQSNVSLSSPAPPPSPLQPLIKSTPASAIASESSLSEKPTSGSIDLTEPAVDESKENEDSTSSTSPSSSSSSSIATADPAVDENPQETESPAKTVDQSSTEASSKILISSSHPDDDCLDPSTSPLREEACQKTPVRESHDYSDGFADLALLITQGVNFLESRESSKWDDEGGYQFHPWNRDQKKKAVQSPKVEDSNAAPVHPIEPISPTAATKPFPSESQHLPSQPLPPMAVPGQNSILLKENNDEQPSKPSQKHSLDDEELQRIVSAHILF